MKHLGDITQINGALIYPVAVTKYWFPKAVLSQDDPDARLNAMLGLEVV